MNGAATVLAAGNIEVGNHRTTTVVGMTVNVDTVYSSLIAGLIVLGLGLYMARRASSGRPSKLQLAWETIVGTVQKQVESSMGPVAPFVIPLAVTLFLFILIANWLGLIPLTVLEEIVKPFTLALRLFGNIFAGGIMIALIGLIPSWLLWLPNGLWKGFDMVIGLIQAFIFALLTILYFGFALGEEEH